MNCSFARMNYLGHAYLSFHSPPILVGNMISDFIKGREQFMFSGNIQKGILLHRKIDAFTDTHPATKKAIAVFRPHYRLYSAPIMDILYDHFLANDESIFDATSLKSFSQDVYRQLEIYSSVLPNRFLQVLGYMKAEDWLYHYRQPEGVRKSLYGLVRRSTYLKEIDTAYHLLLENHAFLNECYREFFKDVKHFAKENFEELTS